LRAIKPLPLTEDALIAAIREVVGAPVRPLRVGIGDDAAAWQPNAHHLALITTDLLSDGVHFRLAHTSPEALGAKALAESLSDVAAMGGSPTVAVVGLGLCATIDEAWIRGFYRGMAALASRSRCAIAGGDIVRAPALAIAITVVGEVRRTSMRLRSGARAGDVAAVTGALGLGAAGLRLLDAGVRKGHAVERYLTPEPRLAEGRFLGSRRAVHAMMDLSDGLSTDLGRMARASGVDAVVERERLDVHPSVEIAGVDPIDLILHGGDDYELLVAVDPRAFAHVARAFRARFSRPLAPVGRFEAGTEAVWIESNGKRRPLAPSGYDHLRGQL
jgi:thiamine-monophosphate kinase